MPPTSDPTDEVSIGEAREALGRASAVVNALASAVTGIVAVIGFLLASRVSAPLVVQALLAGVVALVLGVPCGIAISLRMRRLVSRAEALSDARQRRVDEAGRRQEFSSVVADALDMIDDEDEALRVVERTFAYVLPDQPVELLLADNSHAHLARKAFTAPQGHAASCEVGSPHECPAARRARVQEFPDSEAINACPKLQGRTMGRCSALCIPVSMMGRTVGVIHTISPFGTEIGTEATTDLRLVAAQAGTRLSMLRVMAETQVQATRDGLTGLMNRRAMENSYLHLLDTSSTTTVAMADLDHFKQLNDTYGHATGDRALRAFAQTLQGSLRAEDLVSRRGGEEFSIVFPNCDSKAAADALQRAQTQLQLALTVGGLPTFTASFGVVEANADEVFEETLTRADVALFAAKRAGRDRIVIHDQHGIQVQDAPAPLSSTELKPARAVASSALSAVDSSAL